MIDRRYTRTLYYFCWVLKTLVKGVTVRFPKYTITLDHDLYNTLWDLATDNEMEAREPFMTWFIRSLNDKCVAEWCETEAYWDQGKFYSYLF